MADNKVEIVIGARDEASRVLQNVAGNLGGLGSALARLAPMAGVLGGLAAGAVAIGAAAFSAAKQLSDTVEQLDRLATRTGVSVANLQVMRQVIEESGGHVESLTTALSFLNRAIANQDPLLKKLGITTKDSFEAFRQLAAAFSSSDDAAKKNAISFKLLGRGGADLIADMEALTASFDETKIAMQESGALIRDDVLPAARELDSQLDELARNWKGAWQSIQAATIAPITFIVTGINSVIDAFRRLRSVVPRGLGLGMAGAFGAAGGMAGGVTGAPNAAKVAKDALAGVDLGDGKAAPLSLKTMLERALIPDPSELLQLRTRIPKFKVSDFIEVPEARDSPFQRVLGEWNEVVREMLSSAGVLREGLGSVFFGLQRGFTEVFVGITGQAQTFKSALVTIFRALVQEVLAQLAALAAARVFQLLLSLVGVIVPGAGAIAGGAGGLIGGTGGFGGAAPRLPMFPVGSGGGISSSRAGGDTFNIYTIDGRGMLEQIQSGGIRKANDTLRFQGAY